MKKRGMEREREREGKREGGIKGTCKCYGHTHAHCTLPESITNLIPSIVIDVSAILVDITHFLTPSGATSNT